MTRPARRRVNGDGSLTKRADGRWMGRYYAWTSAGTRKRVNAYGKTRQEAADKMREAQERNRQGIPVPDRAWKLGDWLDYWLEHVVAANRRPATYALYETTIRLYLKPALGKYPLARLSAAKVQAYLTGQLTAGHSVRSVQVMKTVLSSALTRAMREELVMRNVARLAELPAWERKPITPWTVAEARAFLDAASSDPLYPGFMILLLYGLRRGEVLGLRWHDVDDEDGELRIRQHIQRVHGELRIGPVKTAAGRRDLPLLDRAIEVLEMRRAAQTADRAELARAWLDSGLVSTTRRGGRSSPATSPGPFPHLRRPRPAGNQRASPAAYHRDAAQESRRPGPRRSAQPRPLPAGRDAGDLHP